MVALRSLFRVSDRFACRVVGQHRSTQRHGGKVVFREEAKLRRRLREIAAEHIRWSRRMAYRLLRRESLTVNHKWVHRLWCEEGLQRPTPRSRSGPGRQTARCVVTKQSTRTRCGPWTSSSMPPLMGAASSS